MPFVIPGAATGTESLVLDGLDLSQGVGGAIQLLAFSPPLFKKRVEWVEAADGDGAIPARDPLMSIGDATVTVGVYGVSRDDAMTSVQSIVEKLEEAERNQGGIPLVWTPSDSTVSGTAYVLTGEVTEFPVDWESGYMSNAPQVTFTLSCAPGWYTDPVTYPGTATDGPVVTLDLAGVPGDVPSPATLTVTDMSSQARRTVEWGAEHRYYNPGAAWPLILDSDSLVTSGFSGTQTTLATAYDPNATGNNIISSAIYLSPQAVCGTGSQPHIGTFRVSARINTGTGGLTDTSFRFAWRVGDNAYTTNDPYITTQTAAQRYLDVPLGIITIPEATTGTQTWDGRIEAWRCDGAGDTVYVDYIRLTPVEAGYGKARASAHALDPGVVVANDNFSGIVHAAALNGRVAPVGGTWATSGATTDFVGFVVGGSSYVQRQSITAAGARYAVLGTTTYGDVDTSVTIYADGRTVFPYLSGLVARYTDTSNVLRGYFQNHTRTLVLEVIAGGVTTSYSTTISITGRANSRLRLVAWTSGTALLRLEDLSGSVIGGPLVINNANLKTGGTIATGKAGIMDQFTSATGSPGTLFRSYDDFSIATAATEPVVLNSGQSLEIRHDGAERENTTGGTWGRPPSYRGARFWVKPAGDAGRTTRVAVKAARNDLDVMSDDNLTDQIKLDVTVTPRYAVIPKP